VKKILVVAGIWTIALGTVTSGMNNQETITINNTGCPKSKAQPDRKKVIWTQELSKSYAKIQMKLHYPKWDKAEHQALMKLWGKESAWNHKAKNPTSTAFGIPQLLDLNTKTPAPRQIERGLEYIKHRYKKPSVAWAHWENKNWY